MARFSETQQYILNLYFGVPAIIALGWLAARGSEHEMIRGDCLEIAYALGISAIVLTIGCLCSRIRLACSILKIGAIAYSIFGIFGVIMFMGGWSDLEWWSIPMIIFLTAIFAIPACVVYGIACLMLKTVNKASQVS